VCAHVPGTSKILRVEFVRAHPCNLEETLLQLKTVLSAFALCAREVGPTDAQSRILAFKEHVPVVSAFHAAAICCACLVRPEAPCRNRAIVAARARCACRARSASRLVHQVCEIFPEVSKVTLALFYALGLREMETQASSSAKPQQLPMNLLVQSQPKESIGDRMFGSLARKSHFKTAVLQPKKVEHVSPASRGARQNFRGS
jgi:hypothetical protein